MDIFFLLRIPFRGKKDEISIAVWICLLINFCYEHINGKKHLYRLQLLRLLGIQLNNNYLNFTDSVIF